jgi:hypothetical protein
VKPATDRAYFRAAAFFALPKKASRIFALMAALVNPFAGHAGTRLADSAGGVPPTTSSNMGE